MRSFRCIVAIVWFAAVVNAQTPPSPDPTQVLAAAREALGGEKRLTAVKAFSATGRTRQVRGEDLVPIEFEIVCELPDNRSRPRKAPSRFAPSAPISAGR